MIIDIFRKCLNLHFLLFLLFYFVFIFSFALFYFFFIYTLLTAANVKDDNTARREDGRKEDYGNNVGSQ